MAANAKTVLVVDDDKLVLAMYKFAFEDHGYRVLLADDGNAALRTLESQQVDVVFLDILMPEKEGLETLLEIKQRLPDVAVFVMSGGGTRGKHDFLTVAKKFGATGIVKKPATPKELIALIDALPEKHSSESKQRIA
jgi:DNA-binding response OmpR family regulator